MSDLSSANRLGKLGRPAAGEEPAASREGISPALGSPRQMRDVRAIVRCGTRRDVHMYASLE